MVATPPTPNASRILVLKPPWVHEILVTRTKTLEIRGTRLKRGTYYLGCQGKVPGVAVLGAAEPIRTIQEWNARRNEHRVTAESLPYKNTFGLPILSVEALCPPVRYTHPRGAVGIVIYRA